MNFTRSAAIFDGAGPLGARIARLAGALVLPVVFSVAAFVSCVPQALAVEPLIANQARIIGDEARTRIVLDFAEEPEFDIHYLDSPARIVVDFPAVNFAFPASALAPTGLFSDIRFGSMGQDSARIVLTAKKTGSGGGCRNQEGRGRHIVPFRPGCGDHHQGQIRRTGERAAMARAGAGLDSGDHA